MSKVCLKNVCGVSHHISLKSAKRQNLGEIQCNMAYLNHIYDPCARSRKNMRKSAEHNLNQNEKTILWKRHSLFLLFYILMAIPHKLCAKVIHQCKRQKTRA